MKHSARPVKNSAGAVKDFARPMKRLSETSLIDWIRRRTPADPRVRIGIGDDAAVVRGAERDRPGGELVLKTDMIVENVHFTRKTSGPEDWGYKAIAVNLSDMAAMGAEPLYALAAVGLPKGTTVSQAQSIHRGMERAMKLAGVRLVGGDTCRADRITIAVFMVGRALRKSGKMTPHRPTPEKTGASRSRSFSRNAFILRSGARTGDALFVTGRLGGSLRSGRHLRFKPRLAESRFLTENYPVTAMMDVSDGLAKDVRQIGDASGVGFEIFEKSVPLHRDVAGRGMSAAFLDGEDFELLFTLAPADADRLERDGRARRSRFSFRRIGRAVSKRLGYQRITSDGKHRPFPAAPDHHFES